MFFSHITAAQLHAIPLPLALSVPIPLHVSSEHVTRGPTGVGVVGHHLNISSRDIRIFDGLRVTTLERTVFDLAALLTDEQLLGALDNVLWWRRPPTARATVQTLNDALTRFAGRRGRGRLLEMLPLATDRSDATPETAFRLRFLRAGFPEPVPNREIYDRYGRFIALADLQFPDYRMAFDYEGDHHRTDKRQWRKDLLRVPRLQDENWHHTRISGDDLADDRELLARIRRLLTERGWSG